MARERYRVMTGLSYPGRRGERRAEPGDVVDDLPRDAVAWLLSRRHILPLEEEGGA